jgi:hypothetical protein
MLILRMPPPLEKRRKKYIMIIIKTDKEIQSMRAGGKIHARVLRLVAERAVAGISTLTLDQYAEQLVRDAGARPAFKGYQPDGQNSPFPATHRQFLAEAWVHRPKSKEMNLRTLRQWLALLLARLTMNTFVCFRRMPD